MSARPPAPRRAVLPPGRSLRVIGFDDAPFARRRGAPVRVLGVVCAGTRFEGMLATTVRRDGWNATRALCDALAGSKFLSQLHLVLLDGIAFGGFNVVDLAALHASTGLPCATVLRRRPDLAAVEAALHKLPRPERRLALVRRAGPVYERAPFFFQVCGASPEATADALARVTDRGHVPEALRLAHLIGGALALGQSGQRA